MIEGRASGASLARGERQYYRAKQRWGRSHGYAWAYDGANVVGFVPRLGHGENPKAWAEWTHSEDFLKASCKRPGWAELFRRQW